MYEKLFAEVLERTFAPYMERGEELTPETVEGILATAVNDLLPAFVQEVGQGDYKATVKELGLSFVLDGFDGTEDSCCRAVLKSQLANDIFNALEQVTQELKAQVEAVV